MAVMFSKIHKVIRRSGGGYVNGIWVPALESSPEDMVLHIQPASDSDYLRVQTTSGGRRVTAMVTVTADIDAGLHVAGDDDYPGDIVIYNGRRWIVIGSARFDSLVNSSTNHMRYMATLEAEHAANEAMS